MQIMKKIVSVTILAILLFTMNIYADNSNITSLYVDSTNGSDDNNGSMQHPFKTLERAATEARKGNSKQEILIFKGIYEISDMSNLSGTSNTNIVYHANGESSPIIKIISENEMSLEHVSFEGITFEGPYGIKLSNSANVDFDKCNFENIDGVGVIIGDMCQNCNIRNSRFENIGASAVIISNTQIPENATLNCSVVNNSFNKCCTKDSTHAVIYLGSGNNSKIIGNNITDYRGSAIECGQNYTVTPALPMLSNISVTNNYIHVKNATAIPVKVYGANGASDTAPNILTDNYIVSDYSPEFVAIELGKAAQYWCVMKNVIQGFGNAVITNEVLKNSISINDNYCDIYGDRPLVADVENAINYRCFNGVRIGDASETASHIMNTAGFAQSVDGTELFRIMPEKRVFELNPGESFSLNTNAYDRNGNLINKNDLNITYSVKDEDKENISVTQNGMVNVTGIAKGAIDVSVQYKGKTLNTVLFVTEKIKNDVTSVMYSNKGVLRPVEYNSEFYGEKVHHYIQFNSGSVTYSVNLPDDNEYKLYMSVAKDKNMGIFRIYVNGEVLSQSFDLFGDRQMINFDLGTVKNTENGVKVRIECIGKNPLSAGTGFLTTGFHLAK